MKRFPLYLSVLLLTLALLLPCSCGRRQNTFRIGVAQCDDNEWRQRMNREMLSEADFAGNMTLEIRTTTGSGRQQAADIDYFVSSGVDLIIVSPVDTAGVTPAIDRARAAGIPIVMVDRKCGKKNYTAYIGTDNYQVGRDAGLYIVARLKGRGTVMEITGKPGSTTAHERHRGFCDALATAPGIRLTASVSGQWHRKPAAALADSLLAQLHAPDFVFAHNDEMALGVCDAARRRGIRIPVVGVDALPGKSGGVELVEQGMLQATMLYPTAGDTIVRVANAILTGQPFARETRLATALVDSTNAHLLNLQIAQTAEREKRIDALSRRVSLFLDHDATQNMLLTAAATILVLVAALLLLILRAYWTKVKTNRELAEQTRKLETQRDQLIALSRQVEEATQSKLAFYTNVSHDLRTPLTLISAPAEQLLEDESLSRPQRRLVILIRRNALILLRLINQVLDLRRDESGELKLTRTTTDLRLTTKEWSEAFRTLAVHRHVRLTVSLPCDGAPYMVGAFDRGKLEAIFYNLLSNAFKFTPENGHVEVTLSSEHDAGGRPWVVLTVQDNGQGIPAAHIAHIFDRFYQVDVNHSGTGIGLALVKAFAEIHGGSVSVDSAEGKGTTFAVRLPWVAPQEGKPEAAGPDAETLEAGEWTDEPEQPAPADDSRPTVLVTDDNADMRRYLAQLLEPAYRVVTATDGRSGLQRALTVLPDLVICDIRMEEMDGLKCLRRLKSEVLTSHIPVMILTACALDDERVRGYEGGADAYMAKPFAPKELLARVRNLVAAHRQMHEVLVQRGMTPGALPPEADRTFATRLHELVEARLQDPELSVEDLGAELGLGRSQFYRKVKALTNYSPVELLRAARLKRASLLLAQTEKTVAEIAYLVGFSSPSYFAKCYKDFFGESPTDFLRRKRGEA